jgi:hypothetical protein
MDVITNFLTVFKMEHLYISIRNNKDFKCVAFSKEDRKINIYTKSHIDCRIDSLGKGIFVVYEYAESWTKIHTGNLEETIDFINSSPYVESRIQPF